ncbi:ATP-binding protein [Rhodococcus fascians]|nr:ATP-binding protein [Rhodococcus fascians]MBY4140517.1 ATP-binding protein [Rhodococcus fascians]MBY4219015.1 ATP-binding protein [Rhodococcus fascians]MBY4221967.1 ATP-binding protein [Rhodococcus fascians]MBY4233968.1 ATP-binding protein [Rhodococcus fascians]
MTASHYLGPDKPRFAPSSWGDIETAAASGILDEGRWVELKKEVPATNKATNKELAKDLASLSVEGGTLIIGIEEAKAGIAGKVVGADLSSLQTRINQVSQSTIRPSLHVATSIFPNPDDPALGVMVVTVPASASAPHMVDGNYWGRTEHGKSPLSDDQVRRLMGNRHPAVEEFKARLAAVSEDHRALDATLRRSGQLVLRFEPIAPSYTGPVSDAMTGHPGHAIAELITGTQSIHQPFLSDADQKNPHSDGWFVTSLRKNDPYAARQPRGSVLVELTKVSVLVDDEGAWSIVSGAATRPCGNDPDGELCVYTRHILEMTHIACAAVAKFSTDKAHYYGEWRVGVRIDNLADTKPSEAFRQDSYRFADVEPFKRPTYESVTTTSTQELEGHPSQIVERLLKNLLRGMGLDDYYFPYTDLTDKISIC